MPELPEVETVRNTLKNIILNRIIVDVKVLYDKIIKNISVEDFINKLKNQTFIDIYRRGKYLIFVLNDFYLISHLRMEGKYRLQRTEPIEKHEHIIFYLDDGTNLRYHDVRKFGTMYLYPIMPMEELLKLTPLNNVGYEPFDEDLTVDYIYSRFQKISKPIKTTLLDQTLISGLGNIYANEVCFRCHIHPLTSTKSLDKTQVETIIINSKMVLSKAIEEGGTTIRTFESAHGISGLFQNELLVHMKEECSVCHSKIKKIKVGGRGTYFCEICQKLIDKEKQIEYTKEKKR